MRGGPCTTCPHILWSHSPSTFLVKLDCSYFDLDMSGLEMNWPCFADILARWRLLPFRQSNHGMFAARVKVERWVSGQKVEAYGLFYRQGWSRMGVVSNFQNMPYLRIPKTAPSLHWNPPIDDNLRFTVVMIDLGRSALSIKHAGISNSTTYTRLYGCQTYKFTLLLLLLGCRKYSK